MRKTHWGVNHGTMMCIDHADELTKTLLCQTHFMYAILNSGQNTLLEEFESSSKWMNITHKPGPEIAEAPFSGQYASCCGVCIPCSVADYDT